MLISAHVGVGAVIGSTLARRGAPVGPGRLAAAGVLGVASHFACDMVPHWGTAEPAGIRDRSFLAVAVPDGLLGLTFLTAAVARAPRGQRLLMAVATLGACLPDADKVGEFALGFSPYPQWLDAWHGSIQRESPRRLKGDVARAAALAMFVLTR